MYGRSVGGVLVALVLGVIIFIAKSGDKSKDERAIRYEMLEYIASSDAYKSERDYVEFIFSDAHDTAFSHHYSLGSRWRPNRFDQSGYTDEVFDIMITRARSDRHPKVADGLTKHAESTPPPRLLKK